MPGLAYLDEVCVWFHLIRSTTLGFPCAAAPPMFSLRESSTFESFRRVSSRVPQLAPSLRLLLRSFTLSPDRTFTRCTATLWYRTPSFSVSHHHSHPEPHQPLSRIR